LFDITWFVLFFFVLVLVLVLTNKFILSVCLSVCPSVRPSVAKIAAKKCYFSDFFCYFWLFSVAPPLLEEANSAIFRYFLLIFRCPPPPGKFSADALAADLCNQWRIKWRLRG